MELVILWAQNISRSGNFSSKLTISQSFSKHIFLLQAFQLTSHKQLEQNKTVENIIEEIMEESDESPPYLPAPSAPSPSQDFVEKSV